MSGESLVTVLFSIWMLITAAVLVPAFLQKGTEELPGPADRPDSLEDFVEAVARGDFEAAEQAAVLVFDSGQGVVTAVGTDGAQTSAL